MISIIKTNVFNILFPSYYETEAIIIIKFFAILLPFTVTGAFISGIIDGKTRFKKFDSRSNEIFIISNHFFIFMNNDCKKDPQKYGTGSKE